MTAFPQTLWGPMIRNQQGAAESTLQTGPAPVPMGTGSLKLLITGPADLAAFGDSVDFAGIPLESITTLSYSSYNPAATRGGPRFGWRSTRTWSRAGPAGCSSSRRWSTTRRTVSRDG